MWLELITLTELCRMLTLKVYEWYGKLSSFNDVSNSEFTLSQWHIIELLAKLHIYLRQKN